MPSVREASRGHVYLILTMRAVLALRVVRVLHLTKRFESMKVSRLYPPSGFVRLFVYLLYMKVSRSCSFPVLIQSVSLHRGNFFFYLESRLASPVGLFT